MHKLELSPIGALDNGLSKWTVRVFYAVALGLLWMAGLVLFFSLHGIVLEYSEGLADLSNAEWIFVILLTMLIRRHIYYCRHFTTGFWRGISRFFIAQGLAVLVMVVATGGWWIAYSSSWTLDPAQSNLTAQLETLFYSAGLLDIAFYAVVLLVTYLAAPNSHGFDPDTTSVEPTMTDPLADKPSSIITPETHQ